VIYGHSTGSKGKNVTCGLLQLMDEWMNPPQSYTSSAEM